MQKWRGRSYLASAFPLTAPSVEVCDDEIVIALDSGELSFVQDEHLMIIAQHINCAELVNTVVDIIDRNSNDYIFLINCI